jgi:hypothetical protein
VLNQPTRGNLGNIRTATDELAASSYLRYQPVRGSQRSPLLLMMSGRCSSCLASCL